MSPRNSPRHGPAQSQVILVVRVAKCQIFYTDQYRQTRFYPEKNAQIATFLASNLQNMVVCPLDLGPELANFFTLTINLFLNKLRTTSVDDIRQKLADKKEKQLVELRRIEDDIAAGRLERPLASQALGQPIPGELNWGQVKIIKG